VTAVTRNSPSLHRSGDGEVVVLLHCLGVDRRFWDGTVKGLADKYELITYDLPGHGSTQVAKSAYTIADLSDQLFSLLSRAEAGPVCLVGASLGGLIAQHFAATHPEQTRRLVLVDTTPSYTAEWKSNLSKRAEQARAQGTASLIEGVINAWFTKDFVSLEPPAVKYVRAALKNTSGESYALAVEALISAQLKPLARSIRAKTLVLCGDQDASFFLDSAEWLSRNIDDATLKWLSPASHACVLEREEDFIITLRGFLP